jgi:hypothetical protein
MGKEIFGGLPLESQMTSWGICWPENRMAIVREYIRKYGRLGNTIRNRHW